MKPINRRSGLKRDWVSLAQRALLNKDLLGARVAFAEALRADPRNAKLHCELANVLRALGEVEEAAQHLTLVLRHNLGHADAARNLSRLLSRFVIAEPEKLDPFGLKAALAFDTVDPQPLAETALRHVIASDKELAAAVGYLKFDDAMGGARTLLGDRAATALKDDLLIASLQSGVVIDAEVEQLLTAVRRVMLLELEPRHFEDRGLYAFALALMAQGWNNDYAWAESDAERQALAENKIDLAALLSQDLEASRRFLLLCLYREPQTVLGSLASGACRSMRPKSFRDMIARRLDTAVAERRAAEGLPRLAPLSDEVSRRVAGQYERNPYPRWRSVQVSEPGRIRDGLGRYFPPERLDLMDRPYDVLIAGAGTGQQALRSSFGYGPNARLLATDLSAASLAYAQQAAKRYGARNIEFLIADILDLDRLGKDFDIIECVGVLHHMADPWAGWRKLISRLKPKGLMYIGLYSSISRANIATLRASPDYPGPGCRDDAARAYRAHLLRRSAGQPPTELVQSRNFYALNEFRDLVLHESEQHVSLSEIASFLNDAGLTFRGFSLEPAVLDDFAARFPQEPWPGKLEDWAAYEGENPRTFDAMYCFWCDRV
jgi:SAM-dependent methyltransferase